MAKIMWNPQGPSKEASESPIVWGCHVFMREDGTLETDFKGETGFQMMKAAIEALHMIERLRREQPYGFGANAKQ